MNFLKRIDQLKLRFNQSKFQKNSMPKLLSVFFAIIFWLYVMDQVNPEMIKTIMDVKVELLNVDNIQESGLVIMGEKDFYVNVKIKGRRSEVIRVVSGDLLISADLQGFKNGVNNVVLNSRIFADGVLIEDLSQNSIKVLLDKIVEIAKPVKVEYTGTLAESYTIGDIALSPDQIMVRGPATLVNSISNLRGQLDLTNVSEQITKEIPVVALDLDGNMVNGVELGRTYVSAQLGIFKLTTLPVNPVISGTVASGFKIMRIESLPAMLTLKGEDKLVSQFTEIPTAKIDVSDLTESIEIETALEIPEGLTAPFNENSVSVKVIVEPLTTRTLEYMASTIQFRNTDEQYNYELMITPETLVDVFIQDGKSVVESLDSTAISLTVDLSGLTEGDNFVPLSYESSVKYDSVQFALNNVVIRVTRK